MPGIWIIGGGRFGQKAAEKLKIKYPHARLVVVDNDVNTCLHLKKTAFHPVCADGIAFLSAGLSFKKPMPDWIVPAAPIHTAYEWVKDQIRSGSGIRAEKVPDGIVSDLPNPIKGRNGEIYMSVADFICPDNCPEPEEICTVTRKPRLFSLFRHLEKLSDERFTPVVIRSHQLAPGVGGFRPAMLFSALKQVKNAGSIILFCTACRCHGVMNAFSINKGDN